MTKNKSAAITAIIALFVFAGISGCKKNKEEKAEEPIYFSGIVYTDQNGSIISNDDTTDWKSNDVWISKEAALFGTAYQTNCTTPYGNQSVVAYPNPAQAVFNLYFRKPSTAMVDIRLVDENFHTILSKDSVTAQIIAIDAASFGIKDTVRLYYKFIDNGCEFRGHGDIVIGD